MTAIQLCLLMGAIYLAPTVGKPRGVLYAAIFFLAAVLLVIKDMT